MNLIGSPTVDYSLIEHNVTHTECSLKREFLSFFFFFLAYKHRTL